MNYFRTALLLAGLTALFMGVGFLIGTRAKGQMIGEFPGLENLDDQGNLKPTADFRGVYGALFEQWFAFDASQVIPNAAQFARPSLLK